MGKIDWENEELLRSEAAAELLGVPRETMKSWRSEGRGPRSFKLGNVVLYRKSDLIAWLDEQYEAGLRRPDRRVRNRPSQDREA